MGRLGEFGGYEHFFQHYCLGQENSAACLDELGRLLRMRCLLRRLEVNPTTPHRHYLRVGNGNQEEYNAKEINASKNDNWPGWQTAPRLELAWGKFDTATTWIRKFLETTDEKLVVFAYHREIVGEIACIFQVPWITSETTKPNPRRGDCQVHRRSGMPADRSRHPG